MGAAFTTLAAAATAEQVISQVTDQPSTSGKLKFAETKTQNNDDDDDMDVDGWL
jgi:hypothetical protein